MPPHRQTSPKKRGKNSVRFYAALTLIFDMAAILAGGMLATYMRFGDALPSEPPHETMLSMAVAFGMLVYAYLWQEDRARRPYFVAGMLRGVGAWFAIWLATILVCFATHQIGALSRIWSGLWLGITAGLLLGGRALVYAVLRWLRTCGRDKRSVVLVGFGDQGRRLYRHVACNPAAGVELRAVLADDPDADVPPDLDRLLSLDAVRAYCRAHHVDEIWVTWPLKQSQHMRELLYALRNDFFDVRWLPDLSDLNLLTHRSNEVLGVPCIDLTVPPSHGIRGLAKGAFDRAFAAMALLALSPLLLLIALAIRLSGPGPVLFRQQRLGMDGRPFDVLKFRTMHIHHEAGGVTQAKRGDKRVTPVGAILRRTSLDELPQFINVLRGEMSVVGPRPHAMAHNDLYKDQVRHYMLRHRVKPGITGWAQINGLRGETETVDKMTRRVEYDLYYIRNWSFRMDLSIIARTAIGGWSNGNAY